MKMLKKLLLIYFIPMAFYAQVGIGTTSPHASSILHLESSDKGLLVPQVSLNDVTDATAPINNPKVGLLVWNTNNAVVGGAGRGFYFFKGGVWNPFGIPEAWTLKGNTGTNPGVDFIGTTDDVGFALKLNSLERIRFETNGNINVKNTGGSVFLGNGAGAADNFISAGEANSNTFIGTNAGNKTFGSAGGLGKSNVAVGRFTLENNLTGFNNVSMGNQAMRYNALGSGNTAIGDYALKGSLDDVSPLAGTSTNNVAIGSNALEAMETGVNNVGVGVNSLNTNTSGSSNVALGDGAGAGNVTGSGNVFIGNSAGSAETGSDKLYIDNTGTTTPLIYGDFGTDVLTVNGQLNTTNNVSVTGNINVSNNINVTNRVVTTQLKVGANGTNLTDIIRVKSVNFNLANLVPGASEVVTFTVTGAPVDGVVSVSPETPFDAASNGDGIVIAYARVSAADTVEVKFVNASTVDLNMTAKKLNITVIK